MQALDKTGLQIIGFWSMILINEMDFLNIGNMENANDELAAILYRNDY